MYEILASFYDEMMTADYDEWYSYIKSFGIKGDVLELGCGTGNFTTRLLDDGFKVVAVDISQQMLNVASQKCKDNRPIFIQEDMLKFKSPVAFDTVLVACDGVNYVSNANKLFKNVYSYLKKDGVFVFDVSTEYKLRNVLGRNTFYFETEKADLVWQNYCYKNSLDISLTFFEKLGDFYNKIEENQRMYIYGSDYLSSSLREAGFKDVKVYHEMTRQKPKEKSQRIHFVCKKD